MKYPYRLRELRKEHSLTQKQVADLLYISQHAYSDYEVGRTQIPLENLLFLAKYYDISLDFITGTSSIRRRYPLN